MKTKTQCEILTLVVLVMVTGPVMARAAEQEEVTGSVALCPVGATKSPLKDGLQFGPVIEVVLNSNAQGTDYLLDLDTGRVLSRARRGGPNGDTESRSGRGHRPSHRITQSTSRFIIKPGESHKDVARYWPENLNYILGFTNSSP
jgi:hypothetical protein